MTLMRGTIHLVSAADCLALQPVLQPVSHRALLGSAFGRNLAGLDLDALRAAGRALVEDRPRTVAELRRLLSERWPDRDPDSLGLGVRYLLPLVQATPRGVWGAAGPAALTTVDAWLGRSPDGDAAPDRMVLRYLAAFGPASVADARTWSGLGGLRAVFERLRARLRTFRDELGRAHAERVAPAVATRTPAAVRKIRVDR